MKKLYAIISGIAMGIILIVVMAVSMFACSPARMAQIRKDNAVNSELVSQMIDNKLYKVDFARAYPMSAPSFALTGDYYISIIGDRIESFLPYFGRAFSVPYGGGQGLRFAAGIQNYSVKSGTDGTRTITFETETTEDTYTFELEIYSSGEAYLTVMSIRRDTISFSGTVDLEAEFEAVRTE